MAAVGVSAVGVAAADPPPDVDAALVDEAKERAVEAPAAVVDVLVVPASAVDGVRDDDPLAADPVEADVDEPAVGSGGHSGGPDPSASWRSRHHAYAVPPTAPISSSQMDRRTKLSIQAMRSTVVASWE